MIHASKLQAFRQWCRLHSGLIAFVFVLYLFSAPVFSSSCFSTRSSSKLICDVEATGSMGWKREMSFKYYFLLGVWKSEITPYWQLVIHTGRKDFNVIHISEAKVFIDGREQVLNDIEGKDYGIDLSTHNTRGGDGGIGLIPFALLRIPGNNIRLMVEGEIVDSVGKETAFVYDEKSKIKCDKGVIAMWQYLFRHRDL